MSALFAFLHHVAAFALVSMLILQIVLMRESLTLAIARKIQLADIVLGLSAGIVLVIGVIRVFYFEKGSNYYIHSVPFIVKLVLFAVIACLSVYPTLEFLSWRKTTKRGITPIVPYARVRTIKAILILELGAVTILVLCAELMARGYFPLAGA